MYSVGTNIALLSSLLTGELKGPCHGDLAGAVSKLL